MPQSAKLHNSCAKICRTRRVFLPIFSRFVGSAAFRHFMFYYKLNMYVNMYQSAIRILIILQTVAKLMNEKTPRLSEIKLKYVLLEGVLCLYCCIRKHRKKKKKKQKKKREERELDLSSTFCCNRACRSLIKHDKRRCVCCIMYHCMLHFAGYPRAVYALQGWL
uniref:Uncharacterized protein n=1 Tax=Glossina pallidipes TaxID=7398 RepID=A0A1A9Z5S8_GLOPL